MRNARLAKGCGSLFATLLPPYIKGRGGGVVFFLEIDCIGRGAELYRKEPWRNDAGGEDLRGNTTAFCIGNRYLRDGVGARIVRFYFRNDGGKTHSLTEGGCYFIKKN